MELADVVPILRRELGMFANDWIENLSEKLGKDGADCAFELRNFVLRLRCEDDMNRFIQFRGSLEGKRQNVCGYFSIFDHRPRRLTFLAQRLRPTPGT